MQRGEGEDRDGGADPLETLGFAPLILDKVHQVGMERVGVENAAGECHRALAGAEPVEDLRRPSRIRLDRLLKRLGELVGRGFERRLLEDAAPDNLGEVTCFSDSDLGAVALEAFGDVRRKSSASGGVALLVELGRIATTTNATRAMSSQASASALRNAFSPGIAPTVSASESSMT